MKRLFRFIAKILSKRNYYLILSMSYDKENHTKLPINLDYVRNKTLELCSAEIIRNKVKGCVSELGVFKGNFAKKINQLFPDRKFYLFDTFNGFDKRDLLIDQEKYSTKKQDFSDTLIENVQKLMKYPEMCVFKKGYFPDTAKDLEESFCFVSIDADLYEPTKKGLEYFYDRLEKNGYIFVHDFNNELYKGANEAVLEFCKDRNIGYIPIPDNCGSVIITK